MAVVVVGGGARDVGKTALVCGLISALPEFDWVAVKVTSHGHAGLPPVYEEIAEPDAGQREPAGGASTIAQSNAEEGTDTARYLAAGARRAFLLSAGDAELDERLREFESRIGLPANLIFESNRVLRHVRADVCLGIEADSENKPSFRFVEGAKQATVLRAEAGARDEFVPGAAPVFRLAEFSRISESMRQWLRERLGTPEMR